VPWCAVRGKSRRSPAEGAGRGGCVHGASRPASAGAGRAVVGLRGARRGHARGRDAAAVAPWARTPAPSVAPAAGPARADPRHLGRACPASASLPADDMPDSPGPTAGAERCAGTVRHGVTDARSPSGARPVAPTPNARRNPPRCSLTSCDLLRPLTVRAARPRGTPRRTAVPGARCRAGPRAPTAPPSPATGPHAPGGPRPTPPAGGRPSRRRPPPRRPP
jgi:hypothetical protein